MKYKYIKYIEAIVVGLISFKLTIDQDQIYIAMKDINIVDK